MEPQKIAELAAKGGASTCNCKARRMDKKPRPNCDRCKGRGMIIVCRICSGAGYDGKHGAKCMGCNGTGLL